MDEPARRLSMAPACPHEGQELRPLPRGGLGEGVARSAGARSGRDVAALRGATGARACYALRSSSSADAKAIKPPTTATPPRIQGSASPQLNAFFSTAACGARCR